MSRLYLVCFDVADEKRLRRIAIALENMGQRVQRSVFECYLDPSDLDTLKSNIAEIINEDEDHVRYYGICDRDKAKVLIDGFGALSPNDDYHLH